MRVLRLHNVVFLFKLLKGHQCITLVYTPNKPDAFLMPTIKTHYVNSWDELIVPSHRR